MCLRVRCTDSLIPRVRQILDGAGVSGIDRKEVA
jgi:hypothetical protein